MATYSIVRFFAHHGRETIKEGLTLEDAQEHCRDPETSSRTCSEEMDEAVGTAELGPWFDGYNEE